MNGGIPGYGFTAGNVGPSTSRVVTTVGAGRTLSLVAVKSETVGAPVSGTPVFGTIVAGVRSC